MTIAKPEWFQLSSQIESAESEFLGVPTYLSLMNNSDNMAIHYSDSILVKS